MLVKLWVISHPDHLEKFLFSLIGLGKCEPNNHTDAEQSSKPGLQVARFHLNPGEALIIQSSQHLEQVSQRNVSGLDLQVHAFLYFSEGVCHLADRFIYPKSNDAFDLH